MTKCSLEASFLDFFSWPEKKKFLRSLPPQFICESFSSFTHYAVHTLALRRVLLSTILETIEVKKLFGLIWGWKPLSRPFLWYTVVHGSDIYVFYVESASERSKTNTCITEGDSENERKVFARKMFPWTDSELRINAQLLVPPSTPRRPSLQSQNDLGAAWIDGLNRTKIRTFLNKNDNRWQ